MGYEIDVIKQRIHIYITTSLFSLYRERSVSRNVQAKSVSAIVIYQRAIYFQLVCCGAAFFVQTLRRSNPHSKLCFYRNMENGLL